MTRITTLISVVTASVALLAPAASFASAATVDNGPLDPWTLHLFARNAYRASLTPAATVDNGPLDPWTLHLFARNAYRASLTPDDLP